jgi:DNA-binding MarR family transcriptional regulator
VRTSDPSPGRGEGKEWTNSGHIGSVVPKGEKSYRSHNVPSRLALLGYIASHPEVNLTEIASAWGLSYHNHVHLAAIREISDHVHALDRAGLIERYFWRYSVTEKGRRALP